jgi:AcrR family transcriptional regulator
MVRHQPAEVRQTQILEAAMTVCAEKGYHAARIDDIAAAAGLSKGAVYHHFSSKQEVFIAVMENMLAEVAELVEGLDGIEARAGDAVRQIISYMVQMVEHHPALMRGLMELYLLGMRDTAFRERFSTYYGALVGALAKVIAHGVDRGEIRAGTDANAVARVLCMGGDGLVLIDFVLEEEKRAGADVLALTSLVLDAIEVRE